MATVAQGGKGDDGGAVSEMDWMVVHVVGMRARWSSIMATAALGFAVAGVRAREMEQERVRAGTPNCFFNVRLATTWPSPSMCMPCGGHGLCPVGHDAGRFRAALSD